MNDKDLFTELLSDSPYGVVFINKNITLLDQLDLVSGRDVELGKLNAPMFDGKHFSKYYFNQED